MTPERLTSVVRPLFVNVAGALFLDLFLDWRVASVSTPALDLRTGASGWSGWGAVAGILLIALIVWEVRRCCEHGSGTAGGGVMSALTCGPAAFAVGGFFTGTARVDAGVVAVDIGSATWAAHAGLTLAGLLVVAAVARHAVEAPRPATPPRASAHGSA